MLNGSLAVASNSSSVVQKEMKIPLYEICDTAFIQFLDGCCDSLENIHWFPDTPYVFCMYDYVSTWDETILTEEDTIHYYVYVAISDSNILGYENNCVAPYRGNYICFAEECLRTGLFKQTGKEISVKYTALKYQDFSLPFIGWRERPFMQNDNNETHPFKAVRPSTYSSKGVQLIFRGGGYKLD